MRAFLTLLFVAGCAVSVIPAQSDAAKASPLIGTWAVDIARLPVPPEVRPKSVKIAFQSAAAGGLTMRVDVSDARGNRMFAESTSALDGNAVMVQGNLEADTAASTMPLPGVLVMQLARGGASTSTRIYAVAPDGKSMTETATFTAPDGRPALRTNYFSRVQ